MLRTRLAKKNREDLLRLKRRAHTYCSLRSPQRACRCSHQVTASEEMPRDLKHRCLSVLICAPRQHLPHAPMQVLPRRPGDGIVRLRSDQLIPELETAVYLAQEAL